MLFLPLEPLGLGFFVRALVASTLVGVVCAVVGTYVVLRGVAFIGDAIAHAGFPGVVAAYLLNVPFYLGAAVAAVATALAIGFVSKRAGLRQDTAIGVLFAGTFAFGVFLFSTIQGYVADLFSFLFGNVLAIGPGDLVGLVVPLLVPPAATAQMLTVRFVRLMVLAAVVGIADEFPSGGIDDEI